MKEYASSFLESIAAQAMHMPKLYLLKRGFILHYRKE
jgi:hypothetical protein